MDEVYLGHSAEGLTEVARAIDAYSIERWGRQRRTVLLGRHPVFEAALQRVERFARSDATVLIRGETGTGKELFARALYLLSARRGTAFVSVNCAQYQDGQLSVSELFGHRKGSFTGAVADQRGVFEAADGGVLFLDEIGELPAQGQAILLRALNDGEIAPVGESRTRQVNVRVIVATNRDLKALVERGQFREDLYFRLRCLQVEIPAIRERGRDWELLLAHYLASLNAARTSGKRFSPAALAMLDGYRWPGNARELRALVETGFHASESDVIEPRHVVEMLEDASRAGELRKVPLVDTAARLVERMASGEANFWDDVYRPFLDRDLNRAEVQDVVALALAGSQGSYKNVLDAFGIAAGDYLRFMDFLRHHRLKPERPERAPRNPA
jgi:transcriptional regulator with GAF, ATPase, and Fis domain